MIDGVPNGDGNSRYLKTIISALAKYPTYESFMLALIAGTFPVDFNGINEAGWAQIGTALSAKNIVDATLPESGNLGVGTVIQTAVASPDDRWLPADGRRVDAAAYPELYEVLPKSMVQQAEMVKVDITDDSGYTFMPRGIKYLNGYYIAYGYYRSGSYAVAGVIAYSKNYTGPYTLVNITGLLSQTTEINDISYANGYYMVCATEYYRVSSSNRCRARVYWATSLSGSWTASFSIAPAGSGSSYYAQRVFFDATRGNYVVYSKLLGSSGGVGYIYYSADLKATTVGSETGWRTPGALMPSSSWSWWYPTTTAYLTASGGLLLLGTAVTYANSAYSTALTAALLSDYTDNTWSNVAATTMTSTGSNLYLYSICSVNEVDGIYYISAVCHSSGYNFEYNGQTLKKAAGSVSQKTGCVIRDDGWRLAMSNTTGTGYYEYMLTGGEESTRAPTVVVYSNGNINERVNDKILLPAADGDAIYYIPGLKQAYLPNITVADANNETHCYIRAKKLSAGEVSG